MSLDPRLAVIHERVQVGCPVQEAFDLFTTRMGEWWPLRLASYAGERAKEIFLEPHVGGRFFERFVDGDELQVGSVVACEPPRRIAFTWSTADWAGETEVEVTFTPQEEGTRVDLEHRGFDRLGPIGPDVAAKFRGGWPGVLAAYAARAGARDACREGRTAPAGGPYGDRSRSCPAHLAAPARAGRGDGGAAAGIDHSSTLVVLTHIPRCHGSIVPSSAASWARLVTPSLA